MTITQQLDNATGNGGLTIINDWLSVSIEHVAGVFTITPDAGNCITRYSHYKALSAALDLLAEYNPAREAYKYPNKPDNCRHLYQDSVGNCWHCGSSERPA